jgi:PleD family two-component response regulator
VILVVDDQRDAADVLTRVLRRSGYEARAVDGGQATLQYLRDGHDPPPQLVILDVAMADMSGIECLQTMKRTPELHEIPVLMYSGDFSAARQHEALAAGAVDYVVKGTTPWPDFLALVRKHARTDPVYPNA